MQWRRYRFQFLILPVLCKWYIFVKKNIVNMYARWRQSNLTASVIIYTWSINLSSSNHQKSKSRRINETTQEIYGDIFWNAFAWLFYPILPMLTFFFFSRFFSFSFFPTTKSNSYCIFSFFSVYFTSTPLSIFIGKSKHACKLEILFFFFLYKQKTWRKYIHILQI